MRQVERGKIRESASAVGFGRPDDRQWWRIRLIVKSHIADKPKWATASRDASRPRGLFMLPQLQRIASGMLIPLLVGCATMKESNTARTGTEQLLISTAVDRTLDKINLAPLRGAKVLVEEKYLDCTDKNYVIVSLRQRVLRAGGTLVDKAEEADAILEVASGAVGTDHNDSYVGVPPIPLAMPSPISIPKLTLYERTKAMGTVRLRILAYDVKTRRPIVDGDAQLARADYRHWDVLGIGPAPGGTLPNELTAAEAESESLVASQQGIARRDRLAGSVPSRSQPSNRK